MELLRYQRQDGREPFTEWLAALRDKSAEARIRIRLRRIEAGNLGDCEPVGEGVSELRVHVGAGYRVYFGRHGQRVIILLCDGDKGTQATDIKAAKGVLGGMEAETAMKALKGTVSHHDLEVAELRADRALAVEYLKAAMEALEDPMDRGACLVALRTVAEAYGGLALVAAEAGISREALYRALSPKGNPTLKTLVAVLKTVGMRLSVEPEQAAA
jgi:putative addiction module killer protein/probable addiction module antidote protein